MMQIICCENCGNSSIPFNTVSVNVTLNKTVQPCKHCHEAKTEKQEFFFCHENCFREFTAKVSTGEAEFKWKEWKKVDGQLRFC